MFIDHTIYKQSILMSCSSIENIKYFPLQIKYVVDNNILNLLAKLYGQISRFYID